MEKCRLTPEWYHREWDRIRTCAGRNIRRVVCREVRPGQWPRRGLRPVPGTRGLTSDPRAYDSPSSASWPQWSFVRGGLPLPHAWHRIPLRLTTWRGAQSRWTSRPPSTWGRST